MKRIWLMGLLCLLMGCTASRTVLRAVTMQERPCYVALTFDDGPRQETTERLLEGLRQRGASATFFLIGEQIPGQEELVRRMQREGHQVGNHTWSHRGLRDLPPVEVAEEIERTDRLLRSVLGEGTYWLRPPYGQMDDTGAISVPIVRWNVDPRDWESLDREKIVQEVLTHVQPNSIILLHDIYEPSAAAALDIVDELQGNGYEFVTVEELLRLNRVPIRPGVIYSSGDR